MIKIERTEVFGWEAAIRGMRNPKNSWNLSDTVYGTYYGEIDGHKCIDNSGFCIGPNDKKLMETLVKGGKDHAKFMRMIHVQVDVTAPLYWWKEYDTYKVATVANSCSTMHKLADKEFTLDDFSCEHLNGVSLDYLNEIIKRLNYCRKTYLHTKDKEYWYQMIQLLPSSYNQKRTLDLNYATLREMYFARRNHKLDEWREHKESTCSVKDDPRECKNSKEWLLCEDCFVGKGFCDWIKTLPYSELITLEEE